MEEIKEKRNLIETTACIKANGNKVNVNGPQELHYFYNRNKEKLHFTHL